jgi:hypothetical protein
VRVFVAATAELLLRWMEVGSAAVDVGYAVTPGLRESYRDGDEDELEWVASQAAARQCLRLLAAQPGTPDCRFVLAVDADEGAVTTVAGHGVADPDSAATVRLEGDVPRRRWASVLADQPGGGPAAAADRAVIAAAVDVVRRAGGDPRRAWHGEQLSSADADRLEDADAVGLGWYAVQELEGLLRESSDERGR